MTIGVRYVVDDVDAAIQFYCGWNAAPRARS
jgi:hypothetical protein